MDQHNCEPDDERYDGFEDDYDDDDIDVEEEYPQDSDDYDFFWILNWR
jgi:hypothetical protein